MLKKQELIELLWTLSDGDEVKIMNWLLNPCANYFNLTPIEFIKINKINIDIVINNLKDQAYGEAMGI